MNNQISHIEELRKKLTDVPKEKLINLLIDFSFRHGDVENAIARLISSKNENFKKFERDLAKFKKGMRYVEWKHSRQFSQEIEDLLADLENGANTPKEGIEGIKLFFESEGPIIESCDDSDGYLGDVFRTNATRIFEKFAKECEDKEWLGKVFFELLLNNDYGLRDNLTDNMADFLPEKILRDMVDKLWVQYDQNKKGDHFLSCELSLLEEMAKCLKDPFLYEKVISHENSKNKDHENFRMGKIWLHCGNPEKALFYLEQVSKQAFNYLHEIQELLLKCYSLTGQIEKQKKVCWETFRGHRTKENFERIAELEVPHKEKEKIGKILKKEVAIIFQDSKLIDLNVDFLLEMGLISEAEEYLLRRRAELDGGHYYTLPRWAEKFEGQKRFFVSTLIYRALLDSILERGYSKAYHYGVDYLQRLSKISKFISNWENTQSHERYLEKIKSDHKRKSSFWSQYHRGGE